MADTPRFISSSEVSPFDVHITKFAMVVKIIGQSWYYEWNDRDQKWAKLNEHDPEPPTTLPPCKFDGQIVEVPRTK